LLLDVSTVSYCTDQSESAQDLARSNLEPIWSCSCNNSSYNALTAIRLTCLGGNLESSTHIHQPIYETGRPLRSEVWSDRSDRHVRSRLWADTTNRKSADADVCNFASCQRNVSTALRSEHYATSYCTSQSESAQDLSEPKSWADSLWSVQ